jgi:hypothetical protein
MSTGLFTGPRERIMWPSTGFVRVVLLGANTTKHVHAYLQDALLLVFLCVLRVGEGAGA